MEQEQKILEAETYILDSAPIATRQSLLSLILSVLGSLGLIFIAFNYVPLLEQNELIASQHMDYNGFDLSYAFFVRLVFIASAVLCILRYLLNYIFDLSNSKPVLSSILKFLNFLVASSMWIAFFVLSLYSIVQAFLNFENNFDWWFATIVLIVGLFFYILIGLLVAGSILPAVPDLIAICICLLLSAGSIFILLFATLAPAAVFVICITTLVLGFLFSFMRLF